jgi:hypothetical protein
MSALFPNADMPRGTQGSAPAEPAMPPSAFLRADHVFLKDFQRVSCSAMSAARF